MELPDLDTDLDAAAAQLDQPRAEPTFALPTNLFHRRKAEDKSARRGIQRLIRPDNADSVLPHLPVQPGDRTHCVLRGDFVLCDLIPKILRERGRCEFVHIATLGMSRSNADTLACLVERGQIEHLTIVVSHYFQQVDRAHRLPRSRRALRAAPSLRAPGRHAQPCQSHLPPNPPRRSLRHRRQRQPPIERQRRANAHRQRSRDSALSHELDRGNRRRAARTAP